MIKNPAYFKNKKIKKSIKILLKISMESFGNRIFKDSSLNCISIHKLKTNMKSWLRNNPLFTVSISDPDG